MSLLLEYKQKDSGRPYYRNCQRLPDGNESVLFPVAEEIYEYEHFKQTLDAFFRNTCHNRLQTAYNQG